jgi:phosphoribosylglycinamide formyltransferase-1
MVKKINTAIFISGRGSNMKALIEASRDEKFPAKIVLVIANKNDASGLIFAKQHNIPTQIIPHKDFNSRMEFEQKIDLVINQYDVEIICLAGFMRVLSEWFVNKWHNKIINIHPSLLPNFKGANAVEDALKSKFKLTGCTTHFVDNQLDSGKIIMQSEVDILVDDNLESLSARILTQEHKIYPQTLKQVCEDLLIKHQS